jgi:glutamate racemase
MNPDPIAFLDSGVGGLPYLAHARSLLPDQRFVYVADREHFPYGGRDPEVIVAAISGVTERIIARAHPWLIVVACNTASVVALPELRARFSVPFVGVVPAVKTAAALSRHRRVGILATQRTVEGDYLRQLIREHAAGCTVVSLPSAGLVEFVEHGLSHAGEEERAERVRKEVARFRDERIDSLVLGCTHFLHLEREFRSLLDQEGITLVDSREGVSRRVAALVGEQSAAGRHETSGDSFHLTGPEAVEPRYAWFAARFGLRMEGVL